LVGLGAFVGEWATKQDHIDIADVEGCHPYFVDDGTVVVVDFKDLDFSRVALSPREQLTAADTKILKGYAGIVVDGSDGHVLFFATPQELLAARKVLSMITRADEPFVFDGMTAKAATA